MAHLVEQNGPFCDVKRAILKTDLDFSALLYELFTASEAFCLLKMKKNPAVFFDKLS
ncbi:MAG: hypothetical protein II612_06275 [Prevotella sp.]|nr:hypothetical protein [Prevotella sp.]